MWEVKEVHTGCTHPCHAHAGQHRLPAPHGPVPFALPCGCPEPLHSICAQTQAQVRCLFPHHSWESVPTTSPDTVSAQQAQISTSAA